MQMNVYLSFRGECEAAFKFYAECLDGKLGEIFRYAGTPFGGSGPADWQDKVMHGSVAIGEHVLMCGDVAPDDTRNREAFPCHSRSTPRQRQLAKQNRVSLRVLRARR
jgi:uncharacterized glyoxalase superfamily protein PhnB